MTSKSIHEYLDEADGHPRPRILFLNSCVNGGGAGRSLEAFLKYQGAAFESHVVMPEPGILAPRLKNVERVWYVPEFVERIHRCPYGWVGRFGSRAFHLIANLYAIPRAVVRIARIAGKVRPDVIYCNHMLAKVVGAPVGALLGIPVVFHVRNVHVHWFGRPFYQFLGMLRCVRLILANSAASAEPYRVYSREKVKVVNNFVDLEGFDLSRIQPRLRDECGIPAEAPVIGYLGRVVPKKGLDVLITAFARLHPRFPEARLVLVGDNDGGVLRDLRAQYQALARELGVGDRVIFTGFRPDIRPYVADFDVLALPSTEPESFGRVLIEAMALRVPSVITAHGGAIEVVSHGVNGLWTTPGDPFELSEALATMLKDPDLRQRMGRSGEGIARSRYGADELSRKITDLVRSEGMPPPTSRTEARTRAALR